MAASRLPAWLMGGALFALAVLAMVVLLLEEAPPTDESLRDVGVAQEQRPQPGFDDPELLTPTPEALVVEEPEAVAPEPVVVSTRAVAGRLLRLSDRTPLLDVQVRALRSSTRSSKTDGSFRLEGVSGDLDVLLVYPGPGDAPRLHGEVTGLIEVPLPDRDGDLLELTLEVDTGWIVSGLVLAESGVPVARANISVAPPTPEGVVVADVAGRFRLRDLLPREGADTVTLRAEAPWHVAAERALQLPADTRVLPLVEFRLRASGALAGRVVLSTGEPHQREVRVRFDMTGEGLEGVKPVLSALPGADGDYRIDGVPEGVYLVTCEDEGRATLRQLRQLGYIGEGGEASVDVTSSDYADVWIPHVVVRAGETTTLDIVLPVAARVAGRVVDAAGNPLAEASVQAERVLRWPASGADGSHASLTDGLRATVQVEGGVGEGVLTARVAACPTDPRGGYVLEGLPPGEIVVSASDPARPGARPAQVTLNLTPGARLDGVDLVVGAGLVLAGRVYAADGRPAAGARVALLPPEGAAVIGAGDTIETGADGAFVFQGLEPGALQLFVSHAGHQDRWRGVQAGDEGLRVDLLRALVVEGQVLDAHSGQPVGVFTIFVENDAMTMSRPWRDEAGRFRIDTLEEGSYTLTVEAEGYAPVVLEDIVPSLQTAPLEVRLVPAR